jgi:hypothetical protein
MKRGEWILLVVAVLVAGYVLSAMSAPLTSFVVTGQTGVTPGQRRIVVNLPVKNVTFWCDSSPAYEKVCQLAFDMAALNDPKVDIVFINNNVYLYDASGVRVIPRP